MDDPFPEGRGVILILTLQADDPSAERKLTAIKRIVDKSVKDRHAVMTQRGGQKVRSRTKTKV